MSRRKNSRPRPSGRCSGDGSGPPPSWSSCDRLHNMRTSSTPREAHRRGKRRWRSRPIANRLAWAGSGRASDLSFHFHARSEIRRRPREDGCRATPSSASGHTRAEAEENDTGGGYAARRRWPDLVQAALRHDIGQLYDHLAFRISRPPSRHLRRPRIIHQMWRPVPGRIGGLHHDAQAQSISPHDRQAEKAAVEVQIHARDDLIVNRASPRTENTRRPRRRAPRRPELSGCGRSSSGTRSKTARLSTRRRSTSS
jgi:hypothetical protein